MATGYPPAMSRGTAILAPLLALASVGCIETAQSCDVETRDMLMQATASDSDEGIQVEVELQLADDLTSLELCEDDDELTVNGVVAQQIRALGHVYYVVDFADPAERYDIELRREVHRGATARLEMPPRFEITAPEVELRQSSAEEFELRWDPPWAGEVIGLTLEGEIGEGCLEGPRYEQEVADLGSYLFAAGSIELAETAPATGCDVTVGLTRTVAGDYPAGMADGGTVDAFVKRRVRFILEP